MPPLPQPLTVVVASPLEPAEVRRLADAFPGRVRVLHDPALIPAPRFAADHIGDRPTLDAESRARWADMLRQADVLFDFDWLAPADLPRTAPKLRWVQATSSGIGEFLARTGLDRSDIVFTNCAGLHATPLAEWVVMGLLYLVKEVPRLRAEQAAHRWDRYTARSLAGSRVLVVGLGGIGRAVARQLAALGVEVWGTRRRPDEGTTDHVARLVDQTDQAAFAAALAQVGALVLSCPLTPATRHLIGARELAALPRGALVVNIARGPVIEETALVAALASGHLGGAVLDVTEVEPLPDASPLWDMPNVLISPHSASTLADENDRILDLFLDNLGRLLDGRPLRNVFDTGRGY